MLMYRSCRCCRRIANKLLHTVFHLLAMPCIAIAFVATYDSHTNRTVPCEQGECPAPIPNFYSLHSWMGLTTMGLFAMQVNVRFITFMLFLWKIRYMLRQVLNIYFDVYSSSSVSSVSCCSCAASLQPLLFGPTLYQYILHLESQHSSWRLLHVAPDLQKKRFLL